MQEGSFIKPIPPVPNADGGCSPGGASPGRVVVTPSTGGLGLGAVFGAAGVAGLFYLILGGKL